MNKIIFDMDGVLTTEQNYWSAAALTVWQHLYDDEDILADTAEIRSKVFCGDSTISLCKNIGINSNWDLAYVVYSVLRILDTKDFNRAYEYISSLELKALEVYEHLKSKGYPRMGDVWQMLQDTFQKWYLGSMMVNEQPLFDIEATAKALDGLNCCLGIATGRVSGEIVPLLERWNLLKYFDKKSIITYTHVENAEKKTGLTLVKPHPYIFLKAMLGEDYPDEKIISGDFNRELLNRTIAIGDAGADIFAAKSAGMRFAAVLTGVDGQNARGYFEQCGADWILNSVLDLKDIEI